MRAFSLLRFHTTNATAMEGCLIGNEEEEEKNGTKNKEKMQSKKKPTCGECTAHINMKIMQTYAEYVKLRSPFHNPHFGLTILAENGWPFSALNC